MADFYSLLKTTTAYKSILKDKKAGKLSHAYLIINPDKEFSLEYLKIIAKLISCSSDSVCFNCRTCSLIENGFHPDVKFYPREKDAISVEDVSEIIESAYVKPYESDKKVFVLDKADTMSQVVQNKILKTLEEPPENVVILLGAVSEYSLLSTVKSRVKKLSISSFEKQALKSALKEELFLEEDADGLISASDGTVGGVLSLLSGEEILNVKNLVAEVLTEMKSSKDVLFYTNKIKQSGVDELKFISVFKTAISDLISANQNVPHLIKDKYLYGKTKFASNFKLGSLIMVSEKLTEAEKRKKFNQSGQTLIEWLLFSVLEGKYKWQKL